MSFYFFLYRCQKRRTVHSTRNHNTAHRSGKSTIEQIGQSRMWYNSSMKMTNCKIFLLGFFFVLLTVASASNELEQTNDVEEENNARHERSVAIDPETLSELEDLEDEMAKRGPQLSINQDVHSLAANLKGAKGRMNDASSLYRLGKRTPNLSVNQDSKMWAEAVRRRRAEDSMGFLHK